MYKPHKLFRQLRSIKKPAINRLEIDIWIGLLLNKSDEITSKGKVFLLEPKLVIRNSSKSLLKVR